jgi:hypothetical protein
MSNDTDLLARIDRLESTEAIRQLAARYSLSLDMRDLDAHVNLFAPDIRVSREKTGRAHLKRWLDDTLRLQFTGTSHHIGNHIIEFDDADNAQKAADDQDHITLSEHFRRAVSRLKVSLDLSPQDAEHERVAGRRRVHAQIHADLLDCLFSTSLTFCREGFVEDR